jgi:hypothetical protein
MQWPLQGYVWFNIVPVFGTNQEGAQVEVLKTPQLGLINQHTRRIRRQSLHKTQTQIRHPFTIDRNAHHPDRPLQDRGSQTCHSGVRE